VLGYPCVAQLNDCSFRSQMCFRVISRELLLNNVHSGTGGYNVLIKIGGGEVEMESLGLCQYCQMVMEVITGVPGER